MTYVTSVERMAKEDGAREALLHVLRARFGTVPDPMQADVRRIADPARLLDLVGRASNAPSLDDIRREMGS